MAKHRRYVRPTVRGHMKRLFLLPLFALLLLPAAAQARPAAAHSSTIQFAGHTWRLKNGVGNLGQHWSASHVHVSGGVVTISDSGGVGGGIGETTSHTYGTYLVRYRWSCGAGAKYAILLWPANGSRPEIDLAEQEKSDATQCNKAMATWHPKPGCSSCVQMRVAGNFTAWHTVGVVWAATGLMFTMDGKSFGHVPATSHVPMHLSIQTDVYSGSGAGTTLQVAGVSGP